MRGHIIKRCKNGYTVVLNLGIDPTTGKRKQQWLSVKGTKKEAEKRLAELLHQLDNGTFVKSGKTTVADYLNQWLKDYCWANLAPGTAEGYESIVRCHLIPSLGQITPTQLKPEHLQHTYSEKLATGFSHRTVRYIHVTLHKALQDAVMLGIISLLGGIYALKRNLWGLALAGSIFAFFYLPPLGMPAIVLTALSKKEFA